VITETRRPYLKTTQNLDFQFFGSPTVVHATGDTTEGRFCLSEHVTMPPGLESPYHRHNNEDEAFYVLEGHVRFVCDGEWLDGRPGTWVFGPRGIPHGFRVVGNQPARMLLMCSPAGFEKFQRELCAPLDAVPAPPDMAKLAAAAARFNVDLLGPLPEDPAAPQPPAAGSSTSFRHGIDDARSQHVAAVIAGDAASATALFDADAVFLPPGQPALAGTVAIRQWFDQLFTGYRVDRFVIQPGGIDEDGHRAIEHGAWNATFVPKNGSPAVAAGGTYLTVYARLADGSVRMLRDTFNGLPA
jgi:quercetin dioxygenase-like cupin family protein/ketosteroid isomerase-like protein